MANTYAFTGMKENMVKAKGVDLPISSKQSFEICNFLRGKYVHKAIDYLEQVEKMEKPIPFTRFNKDMGHKAGMASGRFPQKAAREIRKILQSAQTNAQFKGLNSSNLKIIHLVANKASAPMHYGRQSRREMKRTHLEVILEEVAPPPKKPRTSKAAKAAPVAKPVETQHAAPKANPVAPKEEAPAAKPAPAKAPEEKPASGKPEAKPEAKPDVKPADKPAPAQPKEQEATQ